MSRRSTTAVSTLVPALKVLSTTLPVITFFRVVRTKAPPLPGLTCWKAVTAHSWPSRLRNKPFFKSFVVATRGCLLALYGGAAGRRAPGGAPAPPSRRGCPRERRRTGALVRPPGYRHQTSTSSLV